MFHFPVTICITQSIECNIAHYTHHSIIKQDVYYYSEYCLNIIIVAAIDAGERYSQRGWAEGQQAAFAELCTSLGSLPARGKRQPIMV